MARPLNIKKNPIIDLTDAPRQCDAHKCVQYEILRVLSDLGSNCVCYVANRLGPNKKIIKKVLLKEYYPLRAPEGVFIRTEEGALIIREDVEKWRGAILSSIEKIQEYIYNSKYEKIRRFLCIDDDIEPLYAKTEKGNGSIYYENMYIDGQYWINVIDKNNRDVVLSQVLQTAMSVSEFLRLFHEVDPQTAYIDIKPDDILIRNDVIGTPNYSDILLFDFDNCRLFGTYPSEDVHKWITERYEPGFFNNEKQIQIGVPSENCTLGKVLSVLTKHKEQEQIINFSGERTTAKNAVAPLVDCDKRDSWMAKTKEDEIKKRMGDIKTALELDEKENLKRKRAPLFHWLNHGCWILLLFLSGVFLFQMHSTINDDGISHTKNVIVLLLYFVLIALLTFLTYYFAQCRAHIDVGVKYFEKRDSRGERIRNSDYNTFRLSMTRKGRTFLDESDLHRRQQKERHRWWLFLALGICIGCVVVSIIFNALPMWFAIGLFLIILFMFADYISNRNADYERYLEFCRFGGRNDFYDKYCSDKDNITIGQNSDYQKAVFYGDEYTKGQFELNNKFYYNKSIRCRNLAQIKAWIQESGYQNLDLRQLPKRREYNRRLDYIEEKQEKTKQGVKKVDLGYGVLQMKQIYKMTFDRLKNVELIVLLSITALLLVSVALAALHGSEKGIAFARIPANSYYVVVMLLSSLVCIYNVIRAFLSESYEYYVTEMAYKSRFVGSVQYDSSKDEGFALNEQLQRDILAGYVQPIDIARGTTRYQGSVIGTINGEPLSVRDAKILEFKKRGYNRPFLHHRELANARRIAITVWCSFGISFFLLVWMLGLYWLFLPLIGLSALAHYFLRHVFLPQYGRKNLILSILKCMGKDSEER